MGSIKLTELRWTELLHASCLLCHLNNSIKYMSSSKHKQTKNYINKLIPYGIAVDSYMFALQHCIPAKFKVVWCRNLAKYQKFRWTNSDAIHFPAHIVNDREDGSLKMNKLLTLIILWNVSLTSTGSYDTPLRRLINLYTPANFTQTGHALCRCMYAQTPAFKWILQNATNKTT